MKSVLVCTAQVPFVDGGAEIYVRELAAGLSRHGFRVDVVRVPFHAHPPGEVLRQAMAWRLLELRETDGRRPDLVIATKFPSYLVSHPCKVTWLVHQYREAYDLLGSALSPLDESAAKDRALIDSLRAMDAAALGESRALFSTSRNVAARLARFNGLVAEPLYPPPQQLGRYACRGYGGFLLCPGRLERIKRTELVLRALARSTPAARLKLTGEGPLRAELERLAVELRLADRVEFLGHVSADDLLALYAECRATVCVPLDEDLGYVPIESFLSRKPVITTTDAGGPLEFVEDGVNGYVREPGAEPLASAIDAVFGCGEARLREMGEAGQPRVRDINWDHVVARLTETLS